MKLIKYTHWIVLISALPLYLIMYIPFPNLVYGFLSSWLLIPILHFTPLRDQKFLIIGILHLIAAIMVFGDLINIIRLIK